MDTFYNLLDEVRAYIGYWASEAVYDSMEGDEAVENLRITEAIPPEVWKSLTDAQAKLDEAMELFGTLTETVMCSMCLGDFGSEFTEFEGRRCERCDGTGEIDMLVR